MRAGARKESVESRGSTAWNDGVHSVDGGGAGNGSSSEAESTGTGAGSTIGGGDGGVSQAAWFAPVEGALECKDGVCPVPWATNPVLTIETPPVVKEDVVNHPSHYTDGGIECIEAIESALTTDEFRGYCKGNCIKYIWRERFKGGTESLKKAQWYLNRLIELDTTLDG